MTANELTREILKVLLEKGVYAWRANTTGVYDARKGQFRTGAKKGVTDIIGVLPPDGRFLGIEIKVGKDRLSPEQQGFLQSVSSVGGIVAVVGSMEEFWEFWDQVEKGEFG